MRKKVVVFILCFSALIGSVFPVSAYARGMSESAFGTIYEDITPLWVNTTLIAVSLSINNGRALMDGTVIGNRGTESITVNALLERDNRDGTFTHIVSFNGLRANGEIWAWERPHMVARGHYYRLTLTATVVRDGVSEVVSLSRTTRAD